MNVEALLTRLIVAIVPRVVSPNLGRRLNRDRGVHSASAIQHKYSEVRSKAHLARLRHELTSDAASTLS